MKPAVRYATSGSTYFTILSSAFIAVMIISNIATTVPVVIGPINSDGAFYIFPIAYVIGDVITEIYGPRNARRTILTGFVLLIIATICFRITAILPHGSSSADSVNAFNHIAVASTTFIIAGLSGYVCGELINVYIVNRLKIHDGEKRLWLRLFLATIISELLDTTVFCIIAAPALGYSSPADVANYTLWGFAWKSLVELAVMPITYAICNYLKKHEQTY